MSYGRKFHKNHPITHEKYLAMKNSMIIPVSSVNLVSSMIQCWVEWFKTLFHPISVSNLCMKEKGKNNNDALLENSLQAWLFLPSPLHPKLQTLVSEIEILNLIVWFLSYQYLWPNGGTIALGQLTDCFAKSTKQNRILNGKFGDYLHFY